MTIRIETTSFDALHPVAQGEWWASALGWRVTELEDDEVVIAPAPDSVEAGVVPSVLFLKVPDAKQLKNRVHFDLRPDDQAAEVARFEALDARRVNIGQTDDVTWVVMADPEGNEFCILRARRTDESPS